MRDAPGKPDPMSRNWLKLGEIAEELRVSRDSVERWVHSGQLRAVDLGRKKGKQRACWRISRQSLEEFLQERINRAVDIPRSRPRRKMQGVVEFVK